MPQLNDLTDCRTEKGQCKNGGMCIQKQHGGSLFECFCPAPFAGPQCVENLVKVIKTSSRSSHKGNSTSETSSNGDSTLVVRRHGHHGERLVEQLKQDEVVENSNNNNNENDINQDSTEEEVEDNDKKVV